LDQGLWRDRMRQPFEAGRIDIVLRAERPLIERLFGALIDQRALIARERCAVFFAFQEILPDLGTYFFEDEADMRAQRIIAQYRMPRLQQVDGADQRQRPE